MGPKIIAPGLPEGQRYLACSLDKADETDAVASLIALPFSQYSEGSAKDCIILETDIALVPESVRKQFSDT